MGRWVECWHPDSPGTRVAVWRPWWRRKDRPFASHRELRRCWWKMFPFGPGWEPRGAFYDATTGESTEATRQAVQ